MTLESSKFMKIKGWLERNGPSISGVITFLILLILSVNADSVPNFDRIIDASINIGAISVGFLVTVVTLIIAIKDHQNLRHLSRLTYRGSQTYLDLLIEYIKTAIGISFALAIASTVALMFDPNYRPWFDYYFKAWCSIAVMFLVSLLRILRILSMLLTDFIGNKDK